MFVKNNYLSQIHLASVTEQPVEAIAPKAQVICHNWADRLSANELLEPAKAGSTREERVRTEAAPVMGDTRP